MRSAWWVLGALVAGLVVGLLVNTLWTSATWEMLGVMDSKRYLSRAVVEAGKVDPNAGAGVGASVVRVVREGAQFVGDVFVRLLRMMAVPLVLFSLVAAVAGVMRPGRDGDGVASGGGELRRLGLRTVGVFALMAMIAVTIAVLLAVVVRPGAAVPREAREALLAQQSGAAEARIKQFQTFDAQSTAWGQLVDVFAANPFRALADGNMLQVVVLAVLLGIGLTMIDAARRERVLEVVEGVGEAMLALVGVLMRVAWVPVFCLTATITATLGWGVLASVAGFCGVVLVGMGLILVVQYPALLVVLGVGRVSLGRFARAMAPAQLLALSTSSSAATMPVTMQCCDAMALNRRTTRFVVPLGTTINMDGTAMYQVLCVTFLAQLYGVDLSVTQLIGIALMAIVVAIGSPGLPGASLVLMVGILQYAGVPLEGLAIILAVDRLLDMARTVVNVTGDAVATVLVDRDR
jgi:Na+/H+-dicarboxylate symporter